MQAPTALTAAKFLTAMKMGPWPDCSQAYTAALFAAASRASEWGAGA